MRIALALAVVGAVPGAASAQNRDYCPNRPGLGTTPCTISAGHVSIETAIADWDRDDDTAMRTDAVLVADTIVRIGLSNSSEALIGLRPFGHVRERGAGAVDSRNRVGDVTLGMKANLRSPGGQGLSYAVQPFVTLPVGRTPVGAGDWGGGVLVPVNYELTDRIDLQFTSEVDAAVDEDAHGRHVAYSGVLGIDYKLSQSIDLVGEVEALRDRDPSGHAAQTFAALSIEWKPNDDTQLDMGGVAGLNHATSDARLYAGISRRF